MGLPAWPLPSLSGRVTGMRWLFHREPARRDPPERPLSIPASHGAEFAKWLALYRARLNQVIRDAKLEHEAPPAQKDLT
jgi:hypothetical protein